jgi:hypothetical protein
LVEPAHDTPCVFCGAAIAGLRHDLVNITTGSVVAVDSTCVVRFRGYAQKLSPGFTIHYPAKYRAVVSHLLTLAAPDATQEKLAVSRGDPTVPTESAAWMRVIGGELDEFIGNGYIFSCLEVETKPTSRCDICRETEPHRRFRLKNCRSKELRNLDDTCLMRIARELSDRSEDSAIYLPRDIKEGVSWFSARVSGVFRPGRPEDSRRDDGAISFLSEMEEDLDDPDAIEYGDEYCE